MNRSQADINYKRALRKWNEASKGDSEEEFNIADYELNEARAMLVEYELMQPTYKEMKKEDEILRLRNRGLDV